MIFTRTIQGDSATLSPFFKAAVSSLSTFQFGTTLALWGQFFAVRIFDVNVTFVHFKFYPWTFQEVPKTTPISKLAAKAATVPETPARDSKPSSKKKNCKMHALINPFTSKISIVILLTVCHTILVMLVWRIWSWIN